MDINDSSGSIRDFRENAVHGTPGYPMQVYINHFRWCPEHLIGWHWHPEMELTVVLSGKVEIFFNNTNYRLTEGEGVFINANAMHKQAALSVDGEYPILASICFLPEFVCGNTDDLIYRKYVLPVVADKALRCIKLSPDIPWQNEVMKTARRICDASDEQAFGFELRSRMMIGEIWLNISANLGGEQHEQPDRVALIREKRLKKMLSFIYERYMDDISVDDIAKSASVSKSECFRCFRSMIGKKPIEFLNEYRLKKAPEFLVSTDMQVTEVCAACGFGHISYFGKLFREMYGMTPREYRNMQLNGSER